MSSPQQDKFQKIARAKLLELTKDMWLIGKELGINGADLEVEILLWIERYYDVCKRSSEALHNLPVGKLDEVDNKRHEITKRDEVKIAKIYSETMDLVNSEMAEAKNTAEAPKEDQEFNQT
jgi:hypothetical protein